VLVESILPCLAALRVFIRSRADTALEILALRQQLTVLKRNHPRPNWSGWIGSSGLPSAAVGPVGPRPSSSSSPKPSSVGIAPDSRLYWRWRSRPSGGRPKIVEEVCVLIRRLTKENSGCRVRKSLEEE
jgi:hypothetical protein